MKTLQERFEDKIIPEPNSGCHLWCAGCTHDGYGRFRRTGKPELAHRVAYELYTGKIPNGMCVLHRCDVTFCCNPDHLFLGTLRDNMYDMATKCRKAILVGEDNARAKITEAAVRDIRKRLLKQSNYADRYGIDQTTISKIQLRKTWKHIQ